VFFFLIYTRELNPRHICRYAVSKLNPHNTSFLVVSDTIYLCRAQHLFKVPQLYVRNKAPVVVKMGSCSRRHWARLHIPCQYSSAYCSNNLIGFAIKYLFIPATFSPCLVYFHQIKKYGMLCLHTFVLVTGTTTTWSKVKPDMQLYRAKTEMSLERRHQTYGPLTLHAIPNNWQAHLSPDQKMRRS